MVRFERARRNKRWKNFP